MKNQKAIIKNVVMIMLLLLAGQLIAQPEATKFQAILRNADQEILASQPISLKMTVLSDSPDGPVVYVETHTITTNQFGLINLNLGTGQSNDDFGAIDWATSNHFLRIEIDESGGTNYVEIDHGSQLLSVPYSQHANTSGSANSGGDFTNGGDATGAARTLGNTDAFDLGIVTNGERRFTITADGKGGFGTTNPSSRLSVTGSEAATHGKEAAISISNTASGGANWYLRAGATGNQTPEGGFSIADDSDYRLTVDSTGKVGIGTTAPKQTLHVNGDYYGRGHIFLHAYQGDGIDGIAYIQGRDDSDTSDIGLQFRTQQDGNIIEAMRIDKNGNVGLGTTSPNYKLHATGTIATNAHLLIGAGGTSEFGIIPGAADQNQLGFAHGGNYLMVLNENGNVGININNPSAKLHLNGNAIIEGTVDCRESINARQGGDYVDLRINARKLTLASGASNNTSPQIVIKENGYIGIGNDNPSAKLHVSGNAIIEGTVDCRESINAKQGGDYVDLRINARNLTLASGTSNNTSPVIFINENGNVGISTTNLGGYKLAVDGSIGAREIEVTTATWSDFVFADDYILKPLSEVAQYIEANNHLPDVPSEAKVLKDGINLGEMDAILLQKIEELMLYTLQQQKELDELKQLMKSSLEK